MPNPIANPGQHLCVGFPGTELTTETRQLLETVRPGLVILFARNIDNSRQLRELTRVLHEELPVRPLIAIDQESRRVNRLRSITGELPSIADIKKGGAPAHAAEFGRQVGQTLRDHDLDIDFAPVLDLEIGNGVVDNALRERCWGQTFAEVVTWAGPFLDGLQSTGIRGCGKHFPGLGAARQDSHEHLPTIIRTRERLLEHDVQPFVALRDRLPLIMVSHGHYTAFDGETPRPATLSRTIVTDLLRRQLGYTGVIATDDMEMGAISQCCRFSDAVTAAVEAGNDLILVCHTAEKIMAAYEVLARMNLPAESRDRLRRLCNSTTA